MLFEWLEARLTPATAVARQLGYVHELVAIGARAKRQQAAWADHLARCHEVISAHALRTRPTHRVAILGSGHCLDVPLRLLVRSFEEVALVDMVHPRALHRALAKHPGLTLIEDDLSGVAHDLLAGRIGVEPRRAERAYLDAANLTVSTNLLSQLAILPIQRAEAAGLDPATIDDWALQIRRRHVDLLRQLPQPSLLIADYQRHWLDDQGALVQVDDLIDGLDLPAPEQRWDWACAPVGEFKPDLGFTNVVGVWSFPGQKHRY